MYMSRPVSQCWTFVELPIDRLAGLQQEFLDIWGYMGDIYIKEQMESMHWRQSAGKKYPKPCVFLGSTRRLNSMVPERK